MGKGAKNRATAWKTASEKRAGKWTDGKRHLSPVSSRFFARFPKLARFPTVLGQAIFFSNLFSKLSAHQWFCENHTCCHPQTGYATVENSQKKKSREILRVEYFATKHGFVVGEKSLVYPQLFNAKRQARESHNYAVIFSRFTLMGCLKRCARFFNQVFEKLNL